MRINFTQLLSSFSLALDLGENKSLNHAKRTAYIAFKIAEQLQLENLRDVYYGGLLHDIGVTKTLSEEHFLMNRVKNHCVLGSELVDNLPLSPKLPDIINFHHDHFDGTGPNNIAGDEIPLESQVIFLADQLDIRIKPDRNLYSQKSNLMDFVQTHSGKLFNPEIVKVFNFLSNQDSFWLDLQYNNLDYVEKKLEDTDYKDISMEELLAISEVFGRIIDSKSKFTHRHSTGLANTVTAIAKKHNFPQEDILKLKVSALLHDIGKLAVPNEILEKPGRLTEEEYKIIKSHVYFTKYILGKIEGLEEITEIAGNHHEKLNGSGYAEGLNGTQLTLYDKLLAICDIYTAITEERPYRKADDPDTAIKAIKPQVDKGLLCPDSFKLLSDTVL